MRPLCTQISDYLLEPRACAWPEDWSRVFGRTAPLAVEIGFGNGSFLAFEAARRPERNHVGIEVSWASATRLFKRLDHRRLTNVRALLADAEPTLSSLFAPESVCEFFIHHPSPWPKARHEERRLLQPRFVALLADRLVPGGRVTIVTDHAAYASWIAEVLEGQSALVPRLGTTEVGELPDREPTKYELKARAQGLPIHFFPWEKRAAPDPALLPPRPVELSDMPSLTLRGAHDPARLLEAFQPVTLREEHRGVDTFVKLACAWRRLGTPPVWMVEALVKEGKLHQEFGVEIVARGGDTLLVKLSALGRPHPTHGVKRAVAAVADVLRASSPELRVVHENLGAAREPAAG